MDYRVNEIDVFELIHEIDRKRERRVNSWVEAGDSWLGGVNFMG